MLLAAGRAVRGQGVPGEATAPSGLGACGHPHGEHIRLRARGGGVPQQAAGVLAPTASLHGAAQSQEPAPGRPAQVVLVASALPGFLRVPAFGVKFLFALSQLADLKSN